MTDVQTERKGLVSVIIPVYNVEQYLDQCVQSVLDQTYRNLEIILVDDGSTDRSGEMCDAYASNPCVTALHQENKGLSAARNAGQARAKGEYVYFLDGDDWIKHDTLEALSRCAEEQQADLVFFEADTFADNHKTEVKQGYHRSHSYLKGSGEALFSALQNNGEFHPSVPLLFLRRSFLESCSLHFYEGIVYEDMLYTVKAFFLAKTAAHCPGAFYQRRMRPKSIVTSRPGKRHFQSICIVLRELDAWQQREAIRNEALSAHIARCGFRALDLYGQLKHTDRTDCYEQYRQICTRIRQRHGYGNRLLILRTYGKLPWAAGKAAEKLSSRGRDRG